MTPLSSLLIYMYCCLSGKYTMAIEVGRFKIIQRLKKIKIGLRLTL